MKTKKLNLIIMGTILTLTLSGCGGGGSDSTPTTVPGVPVVSLCDTNTEVDNAFLTEEYCRNEYLGIIKTSSAYTRGYTGLGVKVAVIDTGVYLDHHDIAANALSDGKSFTALYWDTATNSLKYQVGGASQDQIDVIELSSGGTNYAVAPLITVNGDGVGAEAIAVLDGNGSVGWIYMTLRGNGYTEANLTIDNIGTGGDGLVIKEISFGAYDNYESGIKDGHGTSVAGTIAGVKHQLDKNTTDDGSIQGVAFNAKILSFKAGNPWYSSFIENNSMDAAVANNADIINMSYGFFDGWSTTSYSHYQNAIDSNAIMVIGAGNDSRDCNNTSVNDPQRCSFTAAYPWIKAEYNTLINGGGGWVVVGAYDTRDGELRGYSNKAGITKDNYLVAPVNDGFLAPTRDNMSLDFEGTSAAAPIVSGAMALMKEKFPNKTGKEIAQIFFDTAIDLGEVGVDDVYGHGLINIKAAFELADTL